MSRTARLALVITALTVLCMVGAGAAVTVLAPTLLDLANCPNPASPAVTGVVDSPQRIERMYPVLAPLEAVHWQEREAYPRRCPERVAGPMDYIMEGFIVLAPARAAHLRGADTWTRAAAPEVPVDLRPFAPASPQWTAATSYPEFKFDQASRTVFFTRPPL